MKIDEGFRALKKAPPPDLWDQIVRREPVSAPSPSRAARYLAAALALVIAGAGVGVAVWGFARREAPRPGIRNEEPAPQPTVAPSEPVTLEFEGIDRMNAVASGFGSVWVTDFLSPGLLRVDAASGELLARIRVTASPYPSFGGGGLAVGERSVWIVGFARVEGVWQAALVRVDPQIEAEVDVIPLGGDSAGDVVIGEGAIWVTLIAGGPIDSRAVLRLDPETLDVVGRIPVDRFADPEDLLVAGGSVWIPEQRPAAGNETRTVVARIDPRTNTVTGRIDLGASAKLAVFDGELWALTDAGFLRIDPEDAMAGAEPVPVNAEPVGGEIGRHAAEGVLPNLASGAGGLWFVHRVEGKLVVSRFNPDTESIDESLALPPDASPVAMAVTDDAIWLPDRGSWLHRVPLPPEFGE